MPQASWCLKPLSATALANSLPPPNSTCEKALLRPPSALLSARIAALSSPFHPDALKLIP